MSDGNVVPVMITIGDFARLGRVSVRMLRHYDAIGLLQPSFVDPSSGYRYYSREQLPLLNRIVALKDLGLKLEQVGAIVGSALSGDELRAMLRLRQAEIETTLFEEQHRLARVQARLRLIDAENTVKTGVNAHSGLRRPGSSAPVTTKTVPAVRQLGLSAVAASATHEDISPVIQPLVGRVLERISAAGATVVGPSTAYYAPEPAVSEDALRVHVTFPLDVEVPGLEPIDLPAAEVASLILHGDMDGIDAAYQTLDTWARDNGFTPTGAGREVYLEVPEDMNEWVTEIQLDLAP